MTLTRPPLLLGLLAALLATIVGAAAAIDPVLSLVGAAAVTVVLLTAWRPPLGAYILLATTPLIVGVDRGQVLPLVRPSEAVELLVGAGLALGLLTTAASRSGARPVRLGRIDLAIVLLAITGSVLPLMWMIVRGRHITHDDLFYSLVLWKYYFLFLIVRLSVRTEAEVSRCLWVVLLASAVVGAIGILQSLGVGSVNSLIAHYYSPQDPSVISTGRGSSTIGSSFSVADVMTFCLAIAAGWLVRGSRHRSLLMALSAVFFLGAIASGEISAVVGLVVAAAALGLLLRRLGRVVLAMVIGGLVAFVVLQPVIQQRLTNLDQTTGLPHSWAYRLSNLRTFFWPQLGSNFNWLTGVRPAARLPDSHITGGFVYIESGHTWLLWTGGVAMLLAFFYFLYVAMKAVLGVARRRSDAIGVAAIASFTALAVVAVLMTFDPHLTLRGSADLSFSLLALALTGGAARQTVAPGKTASEVRPPPLPVPA